MSKEGILVINPGSTSTKVALYRGEEMVFTETLRHSIEEIASFAGVSEQFVFRLRAIEELLAQKGVKVNTLAAIVGRGGFLKPIKGGTYEVTPAMVAELLEGVRGEHASNLGAPLAMELGQAAGIPAYIVDPVVVDEFEPLARVSGMAGLERRSAFHALNQKAVARRAARDLAAEYGEINLIVAHLGGGISVGVHRQGKVIDVNNALDGDGPFAPERSGGVPVGDLLRLCFSGRFTKKEIHHRVVGGGGLAGYLGTNDAREVEGLIQSGDERAQLYYEAMAYQVAKEIGAGATVLKGQLDAIVLTGGIAHSKMLTGWIRERVGFLASVLIYPGEDEMEALTQGALRVLRGEEKAKVYKVD